MVIIMIIIRLAVWGLKGLKPLMRILPNIMEQIMNRNLAHRSSRSMGRKIAVNAGLALIYFVYPAVWIARLIAAAISLRSQNLGYFQYDPILDMVRRIGLLNVPICIVSLTIPLLPLCFNYVIRCCKRYRSWQYAYQIIVRNREHFFYLNPNLSFRSVTNFRQLSRRSRDFIAPPDFSDHRFDHIKFLDRQLQYYPDFPGFIRFRLLLQCYLYEFFVSLLIICAAPFLAHAYVFYASKFVSYYAPLYALMACVEMSLLIFHFYSMLISFNFFTYALWNFAAGYIWHFNDYLNPKLSKMIDTMVTQTPSPFDIKRYRSKMHHMICVAQLGTFLQRYLQIHDQFLLQMGIANRELGSRLLLVCFIGNFPINIYLITGVVLFRIGAIERLIMGAICALQLALFIIALIPIAYISICAHSAGTHLYRSQAVILRPARSFSAKGTPMHLAIKLKLMTYFERMNSENRFAFTLGPVGRVTFQSLFHFFAFYAGYLIFSFGSYTNSTR